MTVETYETPNGRIAGLKDSGIIIMTSEDALSIMGDYYYQGYDGLILYRENIIDDFFDLKTRMAGEILQKFSTYRMKLAIVGNWDSIEKQSLKDFIKESNRMGHVLFANSVEQAIDIMGR